MVGWNFNNVARQQEIKFRHMLFKLYYVEYFASKNEFINRVTGCCLLEFEICKCI